MSKRFTFVKNNSITQYQSLPIQKIGKSKALHCQGVVDKLNKLYNENEQLRTKNNAYIQDIEVFKEENTHLKLENEQLKQQLADVERLIDDLGHDEMRRQYEEIFKGDVE